MFDHGFEGSGTFVRGLYLALIAKYPNQYQIFLGSRNANLVLDFFENHPAFIVALYKFDNRYLRLLFDIPRLIHQISPDIAHFQYFTPIFKSCKWHVTIHDVLFNDYPNYFSFGYRLIRNFFFKISAIRSELISTVSDYSKMRIIHWFGIEGSLIFVLPNAVTFLGPRIKAPSNFSLINDIVNSPNGFFLCVSRFEPRKNQVCLLRAFLNGRYWLKGIKLIFVGNKTLDVDEFDQVWKEAPLEAKPYIHFISDLSYADIQLLYAHALASIYPSFAEGFGIPPLEAAVYGTPSLCSRVTAMAEFPFPDSFFFDPSNSDTLEFAINLILNEPNNAKAKALEVMKKVQFTYDWGNSADTLHRALTQAI